MKYRHACHAGNFADVTKHVALVAALLRLCEKERPLFYLDTHAGRGRYKTGAEARGGIGRLEHAQLPAPQPAAVARYLDIVRAAASDAGAPGSYPGSLLIAQAMLRASDRGALCEIVMTEAEQLRREFRGDTRFGVHCRDGFEALAALLPPAEKRGLVLIDPPYEEQDVDSARVAVALVQAAARWPQGVLMAWYPIKQGVVADRFHRRLLDAGLKRLLVAELCVHPDDSRAGLNGSGLAIVNAPWRLDEDLRAAFPFLYRVLDPGGTGRVSVTLLAEE